MFVPTEAGQFSGWFELARDIPLPLTSPTSLAETMCSISNVIYRY